MVFIWVSKSNWFCITTLQDWPKKNSRHFFHPIRSKPVASCSFTFSRAWRQWHVFLIGSLSVLFVSGYSFLCLASASCIFDWFTVCVLCDWLEFPVLGVSHRYFWLVYCLWPLSLVRVSCAWRPLYMYFWLVHCLSSLWLAIVSRAWRRLHVFWLIYCLWSTLLNTLSVDMSSSIVDFISLSKSHAR